MVHITNTRQSSKIITVNGKKYVLGALKRWKCEVCGRSCYPDLNGVFFSVKFTNTINKINHQQAFKTLKEDYFGSYLCHGCIAELMIQAPEVFKSIRMIFPK